MRQHFARVLRRIGKFIQVDLLLEYDVHSESYAHRILMASSLRSKRYYKCQNVMSFTM